MVHAIARVHTTQAQLYLDQICKLFEHQALTQQEGAHGEVRFEENTLTGVAESDALTLEIAAVDAQSLEHLEQMVKSHLVRWGVGDPLSVDWGPIDGPRHSTAR
jgi:hypothetical protein